MDDYLESQGKGFNESMVNADRQFILEKFGMENCLIKYQGEIN